MINKETTHRLMIQVTKKQYNWLKTKAESLDLSISQLVRWLLNKKIKDVTDIKNLENKPKETIEREEISDEEWQKQLEEISKPEEDPKNDLPF